MRATVNGTGYDLVAGMTIAQLLDELGTPQTGVAVARNDEIIRRSELEHETIAEGDRIEIIKAVAGG